MSYRAIEKELAKVYGEEISYKSISRHMTDHFGLAEIKTAAQAKYVEDREDRIFAGEDVVDEMRIMDAQILTLRSRFAQADWLLHKKLPLVGETIFIDDKIPHALVNLYEAIASELRQMLKLRREMVGGPIEDTTIISSWIDLVTKTIPTEDEDPSPKPILEETTPDTREHKTRANNGRPTDPHPEA